MADRISLGSSSLVILVLMYTASLTHAQTFQVPDLPMPASMTVGTTYTLECNCVSVGAVTTLTLSRSDGASVSATTTTCNLVSATGSVYICSSMFDINPSIDDIGVSITCTARQQGDPEPKAISPTLNMISVTPPAQYPEIIGPNTVNDGENNTWTCVADGALPAASLKWRIGNTNSYTEGTDPPVTESDSVFRTTTSISQVFQSSDRLVQIHCDMFHDTLNEKRSTTKNVQVQYVPIISSTTFTYTARQGVNQRLDCSIDAEPTPTDVHWLKDNQQLDRTAGKYLNGDSNSNPKLEIVSPQKEDSGVFVCTATNSVGTGRGPDITVSVQYEPRVSIPQNTYNATIQSTLVIPCDVDANPEVDTVTWKRISNGVSQDLVIPSSSGKYGGGTESTPALTIHNVVIADAAGYQCVATNVIGTNQSQIIRVEISYAPTSITVDPTSATVNETNPVSVRCSAVGVPTPTYAWYFESNPQSISTAQTLTIASVKISDNGRYTCRATNNKGEASIIMVISVWYAPILTTSTSPQVADEGSTLTLQCTIDANPSTYTVAWQKGGNLVDRSNSRLSGGTNSTTPGLTFTNIQIADAGSYRCTVRNAVGTTASGYVEVKISYPPRNIILTPSNTVNNLDEGDALTLTCSAEAEPPATYEWKAGSTVIGTGSSLVIASAGPVDNRDVTCEASNSKGTITKTTTINVSYTPVVTIPGGDAFGVDEGQSLVLPCIVDANPADSTFKWLRDSSDLDLTDTSKYGGGTLTSRNLTIFSLASSDAGNYSCSSQNSVGTATSREVIVRISYKPQNVEVDPKTVSVTEENPFVVTCSANGVPSPNFRWLKGGTEIQDGPVLNVTSASITDAGLYTCQATNNKGTTSVSMVVSVEYTPRVTSPDESITSEDGADITIQCSITANPNITSVTWQILNGSIVKTVNISNSNKYGGGTVSNPSLTIKNPDNSDAGRYQCRATNSIGTGSGPNVTVTLSSAPTTISFSPSSVSVNEAQTIEVTCSSDGAPTPSYTWLRGGVEYSAGATLQINSATPEDNVNFTCKATNNKGSKESVIPIKVSYTPRSSNNNPVFETTIGTKVTLTCPVDANPPATSYTWSYGGASINETGSSLDVTPSDASSFGQYTCTATNTVGTSGPITLTLQRTSTPGTGGSTAAAGLTTPILILIILLVILLIIVIIVIVAICIKKGKCKKKDPKGRVGPVIAANAAGRDASPRPTEKPLTEANSGVRSPQWSAVSRQHVDVTMNGQSNKEPDKLSIEDETPGGPVPNGVLAGEAIAGGTIISVPDGSTPRPHHLPPVEPTPEKKKKRKRKKKHRDNTTDKPGDGPIDEEEEEEE